jgi:hypothetical protein
MLVALNKVGELSWRKLDHHVLDFPLECLELPSCCSTHTWNMHTEALDITLPTMSAQPTSSSSLSDRTAFADMVPLESLMDAQASLDSAMNTQPDSVTIVKHDNGGISAEWTVPKTVTPTKQ